jgi:hypothetical protein
MAIRNELKKKCVNYTDGLTGSSCRQRPFDYNEKQLKKKTPQDYRHTIQQPNLPATFPHPFLFFVILGYTFK